VVDRTVLTNQNMNFINQYTIEWHITQKWGASQLENAIAPLIESITCFEIRLKRYHLLWIIKVISFNVNNTSELLSVLFLIISQNLYLILFKIMIQNYDLVVLPFSEQQNTSYFSTQISYTKTSQKLILGTGTILSKIILTDIQCSTQWTPHAVALKFRQI
jgi:hypothetical protein